MVNNQNPNEGGLVDYSQLEGFEELVVLRFGPALAGVGTLVMV